MFLSAFFAPFLLFLPFPLLPALGTTLGVEGGETISGISGGTLGGVLGGIEGGVLGGVEGGTLGGGLGGVEGRPDGTLDPPLLVLPLEGLLEGGLPLLFDFDPLPGLGLPTPASTLTPLIISDSLGEIS